MNKIKKISINKLGYGFIKDLPKGKDEYYLRNKQNRSGITYRKLTALEIEILVRNRNTSDEWSNILVSNEFNPELVKNSSFFGLNRIGNLETSCLSFSDLIVPIGIYNSTIISCDFGNNVSVHNVNYMSHYILGNEVIINNVNELVTTNHAKFGNGIIKKGEPEEVRIWMEICNENTGRKVLPFNGMTAGDAYLWTRHRADAALQQKFIEITENQFDDKLGYYGKVGDRTVIKNCKIIKDVWIGEDAYLKGANKIKNVTINSHPEATTQIGEGCELVNGIIGYGCRIFYGIKAVRFVLSDYSQLKYGARLINSFLGPNATISCCEVLNSLIFPAHEQHHNNSFLCAATVMGQSNIAAGATLGSNHNSRGADGEVVMGRGFWPGLCVSIKHNSVFASFSLLNKGDYNYELNIPIPFSLISNDPLKDELIIMPGYWFLYNFYALARNAWKYMDRDKRKFKTPIYEYDYLAPDSVNELLTAREIIAKAVATAKLTKQKKTVFTDESKLLALGENLLSTKTKKEIDALEITVNGFENSKRKVKLIKSYDAYHMFEKIIFIYGIEAALRVTENKKGKNIISTLQQVKLSSTNLTWTNIGGQLIPNKNVEGLLNKIKSGAIESWNQVHAFYETESEKYNTRKDLHALSTLEKLTKKSVNKVSTTQFVNWLDSYLEIKKDITARIHATRAKDYVNPFRKMVYESEEEMNVIVGSLKDNSFIKEQNNALSQLEIEIAALKKELKAK
jgi:carbonic anhydrase/acetyltransferase-like protein (isoleucine patch superfamily)